MQRKQHKQAPCGWQQHLCAAALGDSWHDSSMMGPLQASGNTHKDDMTHIIGCLST
jgi:hypothetical protein